MPDARSESSAPPSTNVLSYAAPGFRRRLDPLTVAAVCCAVLPPILISSANAHRSELLVVLAPALGLAAFVLGKVAHNKGRGPDTKDGIAVYASRLGAVELVAAMLLFVVVASRPSSVASESANRKKCQ